MTAHERGECYKAAVDFVGQAADRLASSYERTGMGNWKALPSFQAFDQAVMCCAEFLAGEPS